MLCKIRAIRGFDENGKPVLAKWAKIQIWPCELRAGGMYYLTSTQLYLIEDEIGGAGDACSTQTK